MKHVVGFSGGMSSAVLANHVRNTYGAEDTVLLFHDTKTEPPDNYRFRQDVATYLGMPMVERSDGRDIWQVFRDDGYLGNEMAAPCSVQLKQRQSLLFLREHPESILYLGFTSEEAGRAQKSYAR